MMDLLNRSFYRETVQDSGTADGKAIRQQGGQGVYAHVRVTVRALKRGQGTVFAWNAGSNIPSQFATAVMEGIGQITDAGVLAGLEMTDIHISVDDGSYHDVDSNADAFREAAATAVTEAIRQAHPLILEAISLVTVTLPEKFAHSVEAILNSHGQLVRATPSEASHKVLAAHVPTIDVNKLIVEVLQISKGAAGISSASAGFRPRPEPPDTVEQWVVRS